MGRGGRRRERDGPERRCVATGDSGPTEGLIRFVLDPDGAVVPDLAERLPGRGVWVTARRDLVARAAKKNLFARSLKAPARAPADLDRRIEAALARRLIEALGLARKAGLAVAGFEKVKARLARGPVAALIEARDGSALGKAKLRPKAGDAVRIACLDADELGLAFGRDSVIHAALDAGGATEHAVREARRLDGFRAPVGETVRTGAGDGAGPHEG